MIFFHIDSDEDLIKIELPPVESYTCLEVSVCLQGVLIIFINL